MELDIKKIFNSGDKQGIIKIIDRYTNFLNNCDILYCFLSAKIEIIKFIFEYCEKINKKLNISIVWIFYNGSTEFIEYMIYLKKHNYYVFTPKQATELIDVYYIKHKYICNRLNNSIHKMYIYNNQIIYHNNMTYITIFNYVICILTK